MPDTVLRAGFTVPHLIELCKGIVLFSLYIRETELQRG